MNEVTFTRKELYELVWTQTISSIIEKHNISYQELKNACVKMIIPLPDSGHWTKINFGKEVKKKPLSMDYMGENEITFNKEELTNEGVGLGKLLAMKKLEIENDPRVSLEVHKRLTSPDKLISEWIAWEKNHKKKAHYYSGSQCNVLSIKVSDENESRALRFMDAFVKLVKARGHEIICDNGTYIMVDNQKMEISLVEKKKREMVLNENTSWKTAKDTYSGILVVRFHERAYRTIDWAEGKQPIENLLSKIMANIEIKAQQLKEERIMLEKSWAEQAERALIREKKENLIKKELNDFKNLIAESDRWFQIKKLRNYIDDVEAKYQSNSERYEEIRNWAIRARKKVDWYEPQSIVEDELLNYVDKETLTFKKNMF
jgi:hypothetical protein